jgi:hypothetical protein
LEAWQDAAGPGREEHRCVLEPSGSTGYVCSGASCSGSRLVTSTFEFGVLAMSDATVGVASTTCSKLSSKMSIRLLPTCELALLGADGRSDRVLDDRGVADCLERNPEDPSGKSSAAFAAK